MLVVVDTNVWVSALLNPRGFPARLLRAFLEGQFTPVVSRELLQELADVFSRPRLWRSFTRRLSRLDIQLALNVLRIYQWVAALLLHTLSQAGHWVVLQGDSEGCRDPRDNMFLEAAVRGNARYLVSRDDDLKRDLELAAQMESRGIQVISVQQLLDILSGSVDG
jgi:putative PIN family toxin of toxin-antitoxin system